MIRKFLLSGAALAALSASAFASDLPTHKTAPMAPMPAPVAAPFTWTGFYVGGQAGWIGEQTSGPFTNVAGTVFGPYSINKSDGLIGGFVGYNQQFGSGLVVGLEGDFNGVIGGRGTQNLATGYTIGAKETYLGDVRARLGYGMGPALFYLAGGLAYGDVNTTYAFTGAAPFLSHTTTRAGWTLGGGVDYAINNSWFVRAEYRYTDLGRNSFSNVAANTADKVRNNSNAVLLGVGYKF
ncbi:MAG: porin family protein [Hyphomicrobiales bacterium]|nr:outer membrane beta-barrel protein [Hyphomicrobiales bacterium]MDE2017999.1 porin family protein [Hyphomicrobiales bacterium]